MQQVLFFALAWAVVAHGDQAADAQAALNSREELIRADAFLEVNSTSFTYQAWAYISKFSCWDPMTFLQILEADTVLVYSIDFTGGSIATLVGLEVIADYEVGQVTEVFLHLDDATTPFATVIVTDTGGDQNWTTLTSGASPYPTPEPHLVYLTFASNVPFSEFNLYLRRIFFYET